MRFCFDKPITFVASPGGFFLGGYRVSDSQPSTNAVIASDNNMCVDASFAGDLQSYSFAQVDAHAVRTTGGVDNLQGDSTALSGSTSHNGTRGLTTAPDLQQIGQGPTVQTLSFKYDQPVNGANVAQNGFFYYTGDDFRATSIHANVSPTDPTVVIAQFPSTSTDHLVTNMVLAGNVQGAVTALAGTTPDSLDALNIAAVSDHPLLQGATLIDLPGACTNPTPQPRCVAVDYSFNTNVHNPTRSNFGAVLSDGQIVHPNTVTISSGSDTARAFYNLADFYDEHLVKAFVNAGAVTQATLNENSLEGSAAIGGNVGAFSTGFSTGPDAFSTTFDPATNTVTVSFDQRVFCTHPSNFELLNSAGNPIGTAIQARSQFTGGHNAGNCNTTPPDTSSPQSYPVPDRVTLTFATTVPISSATALEIIGQLGPSLSSACNGDAAYSGQQVASSGSYCDAGNVQQILQPTTTAAFRKAQLHALRHRRHGRNRH